MSTSPFPLLNAVVASRPLPGRATALVKNFLRNSFASSSVPPLPTTCAQAARMFQRADPDELGLGVMMPTPGFTMSSQPWMFSGFPSRTTSTTTDSETTPLFSPPSSPRRPARVDETGHVGLQGEVDVVGGQAALDGA